MKKRIHFWEIEGYVSLNTNFLKLYKRKLKSYGITKLAKKLKIDRTTLWNIHRQKNKLITIKYLEKICKELNINRNYVERSVEYFSQNLKNKYKIKFPIIFMLLLLRTISLVIGDGTGSVHEVCRWFQHKKHIRWGTELIDLTTDYRPKERQTSSKNCKQVHIPNFLLSAMKNCFGCESPKTFKFFKEINGLPREYIFQVFAQLVVDEGSPDRSFVISQTHSEVTRGIKLMLEILGYSYTYKKRNFHIHTKSFPKIHKDLLNAKKKLGYLGGFWFKDDRFSEAISSTNPAISESRHLYDKKFNEVINSLKRNKIFTYKEIKSKFNLKERPLMRRLEKAIKEGEIIRLSYGVYTFPDYMNEPKIICLSLSKEDRVFNVINKIKGATRRDIIKFSDTSKTQISRALNNLIAQGKVVKISYNCYRPRQN